MANLIIVFGTQGAGKSSVLQGLRNNYKIVNVGDEMLERAEKEYGISDRDKLRTLPNYAEKSEQWRKDILLELAKGNEPAIIDTHASIKSGNRYTPGLTVENLEILKGSTKGILYIDASNEEILKRRANDKTRNREQDTPEEIEQHRNINLSLASFFSAYLNIPIYVIYNKEGMLEETQNKAKEIAKQLLG